MTPRRPEEEAEGDADGTEADDPESLAELVRRADLLREEISEHLAHLRQRR
ncbi:hypothetical protein [Streptomyces sulphureus]|uniref:hypothetical protein n=1 Tax=Streptomyces sulphureus TaxID=47758 RepID=UPI00037338E0|nr:hypothetical protein [Streptomyces sulphureus]